MKYILKYPARLLVALYATTIQLIAIVICIIGEFVWNFKIKWSRDQLRDPNFWHWTTGQYGINLREWPSIWHWALRKGEIHPYTREPYQKRSKILSKHQRIK